MAEGDDVVRATTPGTGPPLPPGPGPGPGPAGRSPRSGYCEKRSDQSLGAPRDPRRRPRAPRGPSRPLAASHRRTPGAKSGTRLGPPLPAAVGGARREAPPLPRPADAPRPRHTAAPPAPARPRAGPAPAAAHPRPAPGSALRSAPLPAPRSDLQAPRLPSRRAARP